MKTDGVHQSLEAKKTLDWSVSDLLQRLRQAGIFRAWVVLQDGRLKASHPELEPLRTFVEEDSPDFSEHAAIFIGREEQIDALFFAFIHDTHRGLAQGGVRFKPYNTVAEVLTDGLRLAHGMTRKNAAAGLWWGGGKGIIPISPGLSTEHISKREQLKDKQKKGELTEEEKKELKEVQREGEDLFRAYGRFVASLGGVYYTAEDMGTDTADMDCILRENRFVTCISSARGGSSNPSPFTAQGVVQAMRAAWKFLNGSEDLSGVRIAVQGTGNVGRPLVEFLDDAGAQLWIADKRSDAANEIKAKRPRVQVVDHEQVLGLDVDILAPCAAGKAINSETIENIKARLICGAANNILEDEKRDSKRLAEKGITFVPDYVANRMGIVNCSNEWMGYLEEDIRDVTKEVYATTLKVLEVARKDKITPTEAAEKLADNLAKEIHPLFGEDRGQRIIRKLVETHWEQPPKRAQEHGQSA